MNVGAVGAMHFVDGFPATQVLGRAGRKQFLKPAVPRDNRWESFGVKD